MSCPPHSILEMSFVTGGLIGSSGLSAGTGCPPAPPIASWPVWHSPRVSGKLTLSLLMAWSCRKDICLPHLWLGGGKGRIMPAVGSGGGPRSTLPPGNTGHQRHRIESLNGLGTYNVHLMDCTWPKDQINCCLRKRTDSKIQNLVHI